MPVPAGSCMRACRREDLRGLGRGASHGETMCTHASISRVNATLSLKVINDR